MHTRGISPEGLMKGTKTVMPARQKGVVQNEEEEKIASAEPALCIVLCLSCAAYDTDRISADPAGTVF